MPRSRRDGMDVAVDYHPPTLPMYAKPSSRFFERLPDDLFKEPLPVFDEIGKSATGSRADTSQRVSARGLTGSSLLAISETSRGGAAFSSAWAARASGERASRKRATTTVTLSDPPALLAASTN